MPDYVVTMQGAYSCEVVVEAQTEEEAQAKAEARERAFDAREVQDPIFGRWEVMAVDELK